MLKGEGNEDGKKIKRSNKQKKYFTLAVQLFVHFFLLRCFARLQHETT